MFGSPVLETGIGLALMLFVLATAASAVTEVTARMMKKRAKELERTIAEMVSKPSGNPAVGFWSGLWPPNRSKAVNPGKPAAGADPADDKTLTKEFMRLLKDTSIWQAAEAAAGRSTILRKKVGNSYLSAKGFADAVNEILETKSAQEVANALPESLKTRLTVLQGEATRGVIDVKAGLESWFDETMERAEGAYKRWAQLVLFIVGLVFAVVGNASTTDVARDLWQDDVLREAVAVSATTLAEGDNATSGGADGTTAEGGKPATIQLDTDGDGIVTVAEATSKLGSLHLPVGWDVTGTDDVKTAGGKTNTHDNNGIVDFLTDDGSDAADDDSWRIVLTTLGWLLTALLVMLGGPFWFDLLTRLVSLRGTGTKPPTAASEESSATSKTTAAHSSAGARALPPLKKKARDRDLRRLTDALATAPAPPVAN